VFLAILAQDVQTIKTSLQVLVVALDSGAIPFQMGVVDTTTIRIDSRGTPLKLLASTDRSGTRWISLEPAA
jgi:hypothetical protein